jgi:hypothetical protein
MHVMSVPEAVAGEPAGGSRSPIRQRVVGWLPRVRAREVAPIGALTVVSLVGTVLAPVLHQDGMILALLSPRLVFLGVAAHQNSLVPFVVLATLRLCLADPFHYRLGHRHGPELLGRCGRVGRWCQRFGSRGWVVLVFIALRPIGRHLMWAGSRKLHPVAVGITDVVSTAVFCLAVKTGVDLLP